MLSDEIQKAANSLGEMFHRVDNIDADFLRAVQTNLRQCVQDARIMEQSALIVNDFNENFNLGGEKC